MKKLLSLLLIAVLMLGLAAPALATAATKTATIYFREIKIVVNGSAIIPTDASGKAVEPFILDGTTYLPVRAVSGALGLSVDWDDATSTITLTTPETPVSGTPAKGEQSFRGLYSRSADLTYRDIRIVVDGKTVTPTDANGDPVEPFILDGTTYLPVRAVANALGLSVGWDDATSTVTLGSGAEYLLSKESLTITDEDGTGTITSAYTYDEGGRLVRTDVTAPGVVRVETFSYDAKGRLIRETNSTGNVVTTYTYDDSDNITREYTTDRDGSMDWRHTYDAKSNLLTSVFRCTGAYAGRDSSLTNQYDAKGNLLKSVYTDSNGTTTETYTYDTRDRQVKYTFTPPAGETDSFTELSTYDGNDNLLTLRHITDDATGLWTYTYDAKGNVLTETVETTFTDGGKTSTATTYAYDAKGNCIKEVTDVGLPSKPTTIRTFDDRGDLLSEVFTDEDYTLRSDYTYDAKGNVLSEVHADSAGYMESASYTYDAAGNLLSYDFMDSYGNRHHYVCEYVLK